MIRVAFVNHHGGLPGGGEISLGTYLRRVPNGVTPYVFLFEDGAFAERLRSQNIRLHIVQASQGLMSVTRKTLRARLAADCFGQILRLSKLLRFFEIDVVVTSSMKAHVVGALAARLCGIPAVTWLQDLPEGPALKLIRTVSALCATHRISCSKAVAKRLALAHTTVVVPPVDLAYYGRALSQTESRISLGLPTDKLIFSIVGRVARWKGQDRFIRAAARVCAQSDSVYFAIVGSPTFPQDEEFASELVPLAMQLCITDRISFVPWLEDPRIAYAATDLICNASSAEPFGRTSAEAGAHGVPTLCFNDGGAYEAVLQSVTGAVVPAGDVEAFAAAMVAYAADPGALKPAGAAARVYAQRHDANRLAQEFFQIILRSCLNRDVARGEISGVLTAEAQR
jgi:glycosyltransferase involved in cell wall biosynthesis